MLVAKRGQMAAERNLTQADPGNDLSALRTLIPGSLQRDERSGLFDRVWVRLAFVLMVII
jgi:hypothetical protein